MISLTVLSENTVRSAGLLGEHGLSYWLDTGSHRVLFDTGQGMALGHNASRLGIDLAGADAIVLSHGHYDHVSGLPHALKQSPGAALWFHPAAWAFVTAPDSQRTTDSGVSSLEPGATSTPESGLFSPNPAGAGAKGGFVG